MGFNNSFSLMGIGIPELVFIVMLALVVLGPERLPSVAKDLIRAFFKVRNLSKDLTGQLEAELGVAEIKDLKGIKTGKLIEDWANDELDLDFDQDDKDRQTAAQGKAKKPATQPKASQQDRTPVARQPDAATKRPKPESERMEIPAVSNGTAGSQKVESHNVIGSVHAVGVHPGIPNRDMNGTAASEPVDSPGIHNANEVTAALISLSRGPGSFQGMMANSMVDSPMTVGSDSAASKVKGGWQDTMERRRLLRIRHQGRPKGAHRKRLHLRIQRSRQRKQSLTFRSRAR